MNKVHGMRILSALLLSVEIITISGCNSSNFKVAFTKEPPFVHWAILDANAGHDQNVTTSQVVQLDGSGSHSVTPPLLYEWVITAKPAGSSAALVAPMSPRPSFTADVAGVYEVRLTVRRRALQDSDTVVITAELPTFVNSTLQAYVKASNTGAQAYFGSSVALSGTTLVVGAPEESSCSTGVNSTPTTAVCTDAGAVYVFTNETGNWKQQAYLKPSNTISNAKFGESVALSGDTIAVTAPDDRRCGQSGQLNCGGAGAVYLFVRNGNSWTQQAYLKDTSINLSGARFGHSVSLQGDTLAIGAMQDDRCKDGSSSCTGSGTVFIFTRFIGTWTNQPYLKASNEEVNSYFGSSVALDGNTLAVGAYGEESCATGIDGNQTNYGCGYAGAVYVFTGSGGSWNQHAYLKATNASTGDRFGHTLSLSGDTLAVTASGEDSCATGINGNQMNNGCPEAGAVYVFTRTTTGVTGVWTQQAYLKGSNAEAGDGFGGASSGDLFGASLSLLGGRLAVGAWGEDSCATAFNGNQANNACGAAGAMYAFTRMGNTWTQETYMKAPTVNIKDGFGIAVALTSKTLAVGALGEGSCAPGINGNQTPDPTCEGSGAVYVYVTP